MESQFALAGSAIKERQDMYDEHLIDKENRHINDAHCYEFSLQDATESMDNFKTIFGAIHSFIDIALQKYRKYSNKLSVTSKERKWPQYRLEDCIEVCAQEALRIVQCISSIPEKELLSDRPLMELEQQFGIWQPYASDDDSDDEDWKETSSSGCRHSDYEEEFESEEEDIEIIA